MTEMPDAIDVKCPACGHVTEVSPEWVGRQARCQCGFTFVVSSAIPTRVLAEEFESRGVSGVVEDGPGNLAAGLTASSAGSVRARP